MYCLIRLCVTFAWLFFVSESEPTAVMDWLPGDKYLHDIWATDWTATANVSLPSWIVCWKSLSFLLLLGAAAIAAFVFACWQYGAFRCGRAPNRVCWCWPVRDLPNPDSKHESFECCRQRVVCPNQCSSVSDWFQLFSISGVIVVFTALCAPFLVVASETLKCLPLLIALKVYQPALDPNKAELAKRKARASKPARRVTTGMTVSTVAGSGGSGGSGGRDGTDRSLKPIALANSEMDELMGRPFPFMWSEYQSNPLTGLAVARLYLWLAPYHGEEFDRKVMIVNRWIAQNISTEHKSTPQIWIRYAARVLTLTGAKAWNSNDYDDSGARRAAPTATGKIGRNTGLFKELWLGVALFVVLHALPLWQIVSGLYYASSACAASSGMKSLPPFQLFLSIAYLVLCVGVIGLLPGVFDFHYRVRTQLRIELVSKPSRYSAYQDWAGRWKGARFPIHEFDRILLQTDTEIELVRFLRSNRMNFPRELSALIVDYHGRWPYPDPNKTDKKKKNSAKRD